MSKWSYYCYAPALPDGVSHVPSTSTFLFWSRGDFGLCPEQLLFQGAPYVLLAMVSALYCGLFWSPTKRKALVPVLVARGVIVSLLLLNAIVTLVSSFWLARTQPYSIIVSHCVEILAWLLQLMCLISMGRSVALYGRGPLPLHLTWSLTLLSSIVHFRLVIRYVSHKTDFSQDQYSTGYLPLVFQVSSYIQFGLQLLYMCTLPFPVPPAMGQRLVITGSTQYYQENAPLLNKSPTIVTSAAIRDYGTVPMQQSGPSLEDKANILSLLSFWWLQVVMKRGSLGHIQQPKDLPILPRALHTATVRERFQRALNRHRDHLRAAPNEQALRSLDRLSQYSSQSDMGYDPGQSPLPAQETAETAPRRQSRGLLAALNRSFGLQYYCLGLMKLTSDCLGFAGPLLLHQLVAFMENRKEPISHGYYYALGLFLSTLFGALLNAHFTYQINKVGLKIRAAVVTEVFRKSLFVSTVAMSKFSTGEIVNFMSTDTDRIVNFCPSFHQFWSLPFQITVSLYLLYRQVGISFLAGVIFSILLIPINRWLAVKIGKLSTAMMSQKDQRVKLMTELLVGIRVIKFYAWENLFNQKINKLRGAELKSLSGRKYLDALCVYFWATTPVLISILTFTTYAALGNRLTAAKVFTSVALFSMLISPLNAFPWVLNGLMEAWVSLKRLQSFLALPELDLNQYYVKNGLYSSVLPQTEAAQSGPQSGEVVCVNDGCFTWSREGQEVNEDAVQWVLDGINITVKKGEFIGIVGKVGAGKTSLLAAITAEMRKTHGEVYLVDVREGFALSAQEPWIQNATIRDNILFGSPYSADKYNAVIFASALQPDLEILAAGDLTEVGENGVTLSGGQKARVALARAIYQDKEVYVLDDPLAAVDAHVAAHIYTHCIMGLLKHKTRLLSTHHTRFLREANSIIGLKEGRIELYDTPANVLPVVDVSSRQHHRRNSSKTAKTISLEPAIDAPCATEEEKGEKDDGVLVKEEEKEEGVVKLDVYKSYWIAVGYVLAPTIFISLFLMQASRNVSDWWLSYWISHSQGGPPSNINSTTNTTSTTVIMTNITAASDNLAFYLGVYGGLAGANSVFTLMRAFIYAYGGVQAAKALHKKLLKAILRAPTWFFDITPIGRIINRFSSDLYAIDDSLPFIMNILLAQIYGLLGTLVITCYGLPWFIVLLVPLTVLYYYIQKYYRRTSRELKRLSTVTLSPVYAHFQETLTGLWTIRAMRATDRFAQENEERLEVNQRANYTSYAIAQWLGIRLQMLGVIMVAGVAFIAVLEHHFATVDPGLVGLAISYALSVTNLLSGVVTSFTETEKEMVSVERAMQYILETPHEVTQQRQSPQSGVWPSKGVVQFMNVVLKYREGLFPALNNVTFITKPAEKIGVVGRTGAGKSSLFQALFRIIDPLTHGMIKIDDVNIANIPLHDLRSSMAIIPQDPFLFSGSVKDNLDPSNTYSDYELWSVLERCHLKVPVRNLGGLDAQVEEKGRVFSVGQRQLVCLSRALLTNAKVICIDEATASVDLQTDSQIQQTIRTEFVSSTVITIAHRIDTVVNCDRILVMQVGKVVEFDSPGVLLGDPNSLFTALYNEHRTKTR